MRIRVNNRSLLSCVLSTILLSGGILISSCSPQDKVLNQKDYEAFGKRIIGYFSTKHFDKVVDLYHQLPAYERILQIHKTSESNLSEENILLIRVQLNEQFHKYIKRISSGFKETQYGLSSVYIENQTPHIIIALQNEKGFNFLDFELQTIEGKTKITDFYDYNVGERFSNLFLQNELYKVTGVYPGGHANKKAMIELAEAQAFLQRQDYRKAWIAFNKIDHKYQWGKVTQLTKLEIAKHLSDSLYQEAMIDCVNAYFKEDRFRIMKKFQFYYEFQKTEDALVALDSLTYHVGENFVTKELRAKLRR